MNGVGGANGMMAQLMQVLLEGMQAQMDMSKKMIAASVQVSASAGQMATAQNIIDVYA